MKSINYYFPKGENEVAIKKLTETSLFKEIIAFFLLQNGEPILLRRIKEAIVTEENIDYILEEMLNYKLLERKERRYKLLFPIYECEMPVVNWTESQLSDLKRFVSTLNKEEKYLFLGEIIWNACFPNNSDYFFGVLQDQRTEEVFFQKVACGNEKLTFVSIHKENIQPIDLATYFTILKTNKIPKKMEPLHELVGDIDINYYISQAKRILKNAKKHGKAKSSRNIFLESLILTGDIIVNEKKELSLNSPFILMEEKEAPFKIGVQLVLSIVNEINKTYGQSKNECVLAKKVFYTQLFDLFLEGEKSISYIKTNSEL